MQKKVENLEFVQSRAEGWLKFANELTNVTKCIIEFAKHIEEFKEMKQDDQISALKFTTFDLAVVAMAQVERIYGLVGG